VRPILEIRDVSKRFLIDHERPAYLSLRDRLTGFFREKSTPEDFWALKDVTFDVNPGDSIGIIGRNGAGKSTLLKILSRITPPTTGSIVARGRIASLLEVGTGFHQELTGRENIFMNGSILGMKKAEIRFKFDEIVDFSGIEKFLDTPLKHYSSGMQLRLAFAVAAHLEPEILIVDEVLAVGDAEFQKKCLGKMDEVSQSGRTILFVSHDLNALSKLCADSIILKQGKVLFQGNTHDAIAHYHNEIKTVGKVIDRVVKKPIYIKSVKTFSSSGKQASQFLYTEAINLEFQIEVLDNSIKCDLFVMVLNSMKRRVFAMESNNIKSTMRLKLEPNCLVRGNYSIYAFLNQPHIARLDEVEDICDFEIIDNGSVMLKHGAYDYGDVFGKGEWLH
jgi:lipopolysaccharide transport system ATP-binding protein